MRRCPSTCASAFTVRELTQRSPFRPARAGNFRRVKQGRVDDYSIRRYEQKVVADNFRHGADKEIVVALPRDVCVPSRLPPSPACGRLVVADGRVFLLAGS